MEWRQPVLSALERRYRYQNQASIDPHAAGCDTGEHDPRGIGRSYHVGSVPRAVASRLVNTSRLCAP